MSLVGLRNRIEVNPPTTRLSGFLAGADVRDTDGHSLMGAEYETDTCIAGVGGEWVDDCLMTHGGLDSTGPAAAAPAVPPGANDPTQLVGVKDFQGLSDVVAGDPFTTFAGIQCDLVTNTEEAYRTKVNQKFDYVESRQIDYHMARLITNNGNDLGDCPLSNMIMNADYTSLNEYGSYANIWMSAPLMVCAASQNLVFQQLDNTWRTVNGTRVHVIAQHDNVSTKNFFLTGYVTLLRGPKETHIGYQTEDNVRRALTERIYVPLIECMAYYATATCDMPITP